MPPALVHPSVQDMDPLYINTSSNNGIVQYGTVDAELEDFLLRCGNSGILAAWREEGRRLAASRRLSAVAYANAYKIEDWSASSEADSDRSTRADDDEDDTSSASEADDTEEFQDCLQTWSKDDILGKDDGDCMVETSIDSDEEDAENGIPDCTRVTTRDLRLFVSELQLGPDELTAQSWHRMFQRSTARMTYHCWSRDPPPGVAGGTVYRCHMTVQDCTAETARDFFLDEQHRMEWDDNRHSFELLQPWDNTGSTVARWIRRFPFFLRDREYVVSRRVWCSQPRTFHCISLATTHNSAPVSSNPLRVSSFYSCWYVKACKIPRTQGTTAGASGKKDSQQQQQQANETSSVDSIQGTELGGNLRTDLDDPVNNKESDYVEGVEIVTIHQEDSGLSRRITRMGVAHGMWAHVVKMEAAMHAYTAAGRSIAHTLPPSVLYCQAAGH